MKANMGDVDREEQKRLTHDIEFVACLIKCLSNYKHQASAVEGPVFSITFAGRVCLIQGWDLRCEEDIQPISIKKDHLSRPLRT